MTEPLKQQEVLDFLLRNRVDCAALIETHVKERFAKLNGTKKFKKFSIIHNYASHSGGRIWIVWNPLVVKLQLLEAGAQYVYCIVTHILSQKSFLATFVYAFNKAVERLPLWNRLISFSQGHKIPWVCLGDFNVSLAAEERSGCLLRLREIQDFRDYLTACQLVDHPYTGGVFTWHNKQPTNSKWAKLDKALVNYEWFHYLPSSTVAFLPVGISDHAPLLMDIDPSSRPPPKLRLLKSELRHIHRSEFAGLAHKVAAAKHELSTCQLAMQAFPLSSHLMAKEKECVQTYGTLKLAEMRGLAQRAKVKHLQLSDNNTKYFYAHITARRMVNTIGTIEDVNGTVCKGQKQSNILSNSDFLEDRVTDLEIETALFSIDENKSPGVDGYSSGFFKKTWPITGPAFRGAVMEFFRTCHMPRGSNSTLLALIPKTESPKSVTYFRPISCCTVFYKTVTKILANRMRKVLGGVVGLEQAAFIEGRDLFDNSMLAHEMANKYRRSLLTPRCILKIDIKKAFDSVNWEFLAAYLRMFGFPPLFTKWVLACVTSSFFTLNINGSSEGFFPVQRGLRQGDPLSPYLFTLCMEVLSRLLRLLPSASGFSYHPKCVKLNLIHLIFADDLLVFTRGELPSIQAAHILSATGYVEGSFPVKYLGIPLLTSRLSQHMFLPLLDKIRSKITSWANNFLSYSGKLQLINSVIFGLHNFWGASIILPKGIVKAVNKLCKDFLWGIKEGDRRLVFKSWDSFCLPRKEGGVNIKEVLSWNKSQMLAWIKKLLLHSDSIWVKWVEAYILKILIFGFGAMLYNVEITRYNSHNRGKSSLKRQRRSALLCAIYLIWQERNRRVFRNIKAAPVQLLWRVKYLVALRVSFYNGDVIEGH
ncbi:uncharacterized protein LOC141652088 [Silene latifolia]|uniref:uncharacterized protein LOC141652088 n=1 Tax=Silene latifolia TaxID=37657 RepID=UPI003D781DC9